MFVLLLWYLLDIGSNVTTGHLIDIALVEAIIIMTWWIVSWLLGHAGTIQRRPPTG